MDGPRRRLRRPHAGLHPGQGLFTSNKLPFEKQSLTFTFHTRAGSQVRHRDVPGLHKGEERPVALGELEGAEETVFNSVSVFVQI